MRVIIERSTGSSARSWANRGSAQKVRRTRTSVRFMGAPWSKTVGRAGLKVYPIPRSPVLVGFADEPTLLPPGRRAAGRPARRSRSSPALAAEGPRPLKVDDIFALKTVGDPQISPDGAFVAYTVRWLDPKEDAADTDIYMVPFAGGAPLRLTASPKPETHPRFSPDGRYLAFLSGREGKKSQVWLLDRRGGEAVKLTDYKADVSDLAWSPDGKRLALVVGDVDPDDPDARTTRPEATRRRRRRRRSRSSSTACSSCATARASCATSASTSTSSTSPRGRPRRSPPAPTTTAIPSGRRTAARSPSPATARPIPTPTTTATSSSSRRRRGRPRGRSPPRPPPTASPPSARTASGSPTSPAAIPRTSGTPPTTWPSCPWRAASRGR